MAHEINRFRQSREHVIAVDLGGFYYRNIFYDYDQTTGIDTSAVVFDMMKYDIATLNQWDM